MTDENQDSFLNDDQKGNKEPEDNKQDNTENVNKEDEVSNLLASITRSDGSQKYQSVESALKSLNESQQFIEQLKSENSEQKQQIEQLQKEASKKIAMEDILNQLNANKADNSDTPSDESHTVQDVEQIVSRVMEQKETQKSYLENQRQVADAMIDKFGNREKAEEYLKNKAKELNVGMEFINDTAGKSPKAVLQLLEIEKVEKKQGADQIESSVDSEKLNVHKQKDNSPVYVMGGATKDQLLTAWRNAGERVKQSGD